MITVDIPGWDAHPDRLPASPSAYDDEFDSNDLSAWTAISPGGNLSYDADTTIKSHLYMRVNPTTGEDSFGLWKPAPPTPFTVTAKVNGWLDFSDGDYSYQAWGIGVGEDPLGRYLGLWAPNNENAVMNATIEFNEWSDPSTFVRSLTFNPHSPGVSMFGDWYLRLVVASHTDISAYYSTNGLLWLPRYAPGYAPSPAFSGAGLSVFIGQIQNPPAAAKGCSGAFDWIRFT